MSGLVLFQFFVLQAAALAGVQINEVRADASIATDAQVDACPLALAEWQPDCRNVIAIRPAILWQRGRLEYLAFHEVCHIRQNDQYIWGRLDQKQRRKHHKAIEACVREIAGEQRYWRMKAHYHLWD